MEVVRFADLLDVATSHDINLRKYVMAAAGKYPEGKMSDFSDFVLTPNESKEFISQNELILIIPSEGNLNIKGVQEILARPHDLITIPMNSAVFIQNNENVKSSFYVIHWNLNGSTKNIP